MAEKVKFNVYKNEFLDYGDGHTEERKTFLGETYAVTEEKADSNVRFRLELPSSFYVVPWSGDGGRTVSLEAERA